MFVLGLILILLSAGTLVAVLSSGTDDHAVLFGGSIEVPTLVIFLAGAAALLVFIMGLELVRSGIRRANENRKAKKRLRKLEKREELRGDEVGAAGTTTDTTGTTTGTTGTTPGTTDTTTGTTDQAGRPTTAPTSEGTSDGTSDGTNGPYQTPPPAGR